MRPVPVMNRGVFFLCGKKLDWGRKGIGEAIEIRSHNPELNRDGRCYNLPHSYDSSLTRGSFAIDVSF